MKRSAVLCGVLVVAIVAGLVFEKMNTTNIVTLIALTVALSAILVQMYRYRHSHGNRT
jgi:hypothetical protein